MKDVYFLSKASSCPRYWLWLRGTSLCAVYSSMCVSSLTEVQIPHLRRVPIRMSSGTKLYR